MEVRGQLNALAALPPKRKHRYTLKRRLGGPQSQSEHFGEEKNLFPLPALTLILLTWRIG
jgi:hypothetical protein